MRKTVLLIIGLITFSTLIAKSNDADKIVGLWISPKNDLIVRCYKENNKYFAKVEWFKRYYDASPDDPNGIPESQWMQAVVMKYFVFDNDEWSEGEIFDLKSGKKYSAYLKLNNSNSLQVTGYIFFRFLCQSTTFTKYTNSKLPDFV